MAAPTKKPGIFKDPWRTPTVPTKTPSEVSAPAPDVFKPTTTGLPSAEDEINADMADPKHSTIALKGYGGITVDGVSSVLNAAEQVLRFCVDNRKVIEPTLLNYGIVLTQMQPGKLTTRFYIQRRDGWTLAIPDATTRDNGCLQLIQALLEIQTDPVMRRAMATYHIRPYKH